MDPHIVHHFQTVDTTLASHISQTQVFAIKKSTDPFFSLLELIISQQLSVKAGDTIVKRFVELFPNKKITPDSVLQIPKETLRQVGMSWNKVSYVHHVAQAVQEDSLNFQTIDTLDDESVIQELIKTKGIGRWTAEMFLIFTLGREDVFSPGDVGLQNAIKNIYGLKDKPTIKYMEQLSQTWKPYRSYASMILWKSLDNK